MVHPRKHVEELEKRAIENELIAQLAPDKDTRRVNEQQAVKLRSRINVLKQRLRKLTEDYPEK